MYKAPLREGNTTSNLVMPIIQNKNTRDRDNVKMRNNKDEPVGAGTMKLEIDCK